MNGDGSGRFCFKTQLEFSIFHFDFLGLTQLREEFAPKISIDGTRKTVDTFFPESERISYM